MISKPLLMSLSLAAGAMAMESGRVCDPNDNIHFVNINPSCNWAGTCIEDGDGSTYCACCEIDMDTLKPAVVDGVENCPGWGGGHYKGSTCGTRTRFVSNIWSYYIERMACDRVAEFVDAANVAFNANGYAGKISLLHHRCESPFVLKGVHITLATDLNSFYDPSCFNEETFGISWDSQPRCLANPDSGHLASLVLRKILENEEAPEVASIEEQMGIHIRERHQRALVQKDEEPVSRESTASAPEGPSKGSEAVDAPPAPTTTLAPPAPPTQSTPTLESCVIEGMRWKGKSAAKAMKVQSAVECNELCEARRQCKGWTFNRNASLNQQNCALSRKAVKSEMKPAAGVVSGKKACDPSA